MACRVGKVSEMLYIKYERQWLLKHKRMLLLLPLWLEVLHCLSSTVAKWVPSQGPCPQTCDICPPKPLDVRENIAPRTVAVFGTSSLAFVQQQDLTGVEEQSSFLVVTPWTFNSSSQSWIGLKQEFKAMVDIQNQSKFSVYAVTVRECLGERLAIGRPCRIAFIILLLSPAPREFTLGSLILPRAWEKSHLINQLLFIQFPLCARH